MMKRRAFLKRTVTVPALGVAARLGGAPAPEAPRKKSSASSEENAAKAGGRSPRRIPNEYTLFLPGEREALRNSPRVDFFQDDAVKARHRQETRLMKVGDTIAGWQLLAIVPWMNGIAMAVFERHVTNRGAIAYVTTQGEIAHIPKLVGDLSKIRPRPIYAPPDLSFERPAHYVPAPDRLGNYI